MWGSKRTAADHAECTGTRELHKHLEMRNMLSGCVIERKERLEYEIRPVIEMIHILKMTYSKKKNYIYIMLMLTFSLGCWLGCLPCMRRCRAPFRRHWWPPSPLPTHQPTWRWSQTRKILPMSAQIYQEIREAIGSQRRARREGRINRQSKDCFAHNQEK